MHQGSNFEIATLNLHKALAPDEHKSITGHTRVERSPISSRCDLDLCVMDIYKLITARKFYSLFPNEL